MIILAVQLRIFVLSLVSGWIYGMMSTFVDLIYSSKNVIHHILILIFHAVYHLFLFNLLYQLNEIVICKLYDLEYLYF